MPITDLCREDVVTASREASIQELASLLEAENVGSVVITDEGSPVGIVTDRDLAVRVLANGSNPEAVTAEDVMSDDLVTIHEDAGFHEAASTMSTHGVRRLPVCDQWGDLCGIISADDISELLADEQQHLAGVVRSQRPPY